MVVPEFLSSLGDNPYFGAGFGLVGVGTGLAVLRKFVQIGNVFFRRRYIMSLHVTCEDKSYFWLLQWIAKYGRGSAQHLSVQTSYRQSEGGHVSASFDLTPSPGDHFVTYRGRWMKVERHRENMVSLAHGTAFESVTLSTLGTDPKFFSSILEEARSLALKQLEVGTTIYTMLGTDWRPFGHPRRKRPLSSVVLDEGIGAKIHNDVVEFVNSSEWYYNRGIPYRRGYLLYGPPGCGKSSFVMALASELDYSIAMMSLSDRSLSDDKLQHMLNVAPLRSIILLEDVDAAFINRQIPGQLPTAYTGMATITLSGFLNAVDGVASSEARILIMTTNYVERLDPALIRPGRVDLRQYIGCCSDYQLKALFNKFYPDADAQDALEFVQQLRKMTNNNDISPAQMQNYFLAHKNDPRSAIHHLDSFSNYTSLKQKLSAVEEQPA